MQSKSIGSYFSLYGFFKADDLSLKDIELINDKNKLDKLIKRIGNWDKYSWTWQYALPTASWVAYSGAAIWWVSSGINAYINPTYIREQGKVAAWALGHSETINQKHYDCDGTYLTYTHQGGAAPQLDCISTGGTCCAVTNGPNWQTFLHLGGFIGGSLACIGLTAFTKFHSESRTSIEVDPNECVAVAQLIEEDILNKFAALSAEAQPTSPEKIKILTEQKNNLLEAEQVTRLMIKNIKCSLVEIMADMEKTRNSFSLISVEEELITSDDDNDERNLLLQTR